MRFDPDVLEALREVNASLVDPELNQTVGDAEPRFEIFHFALSLCSQKVRLTLAETGTSYRAHDLGLPLPHLANYDPAYVRLRLLGAEGQAFARGYTGRSGTRTEGLDPLVVPTLVDLEEERVYVDSARICRHVAEVRGPTLLPAALRDRIDEELAIVDDTPHVALFYGAHPEGDYRPERLRSGMPGVHDRKIEKIARGRTMVEDDTRLAAAYTAKLQKEAAAKDFVHSPEAMRAAAHEVVDLVGALEDRLDARHPWLLGEAITLADLVWAVSLYRLLWLGMSFCWEGEHALNAHRRPKVRAYLQRLRGRPSFRAAIVDWPRMPLSEHL